MGIIDRYLADIDRLFGRTEADDLEVTDRFVDPGGTVHTGPISGTQGPSYILETDGSTIDAYAQEDSMSDYMGESDIGPLLETIIVDELHPQGSYKEAMGQIYFRAGDYPGDLSNAGGVTEVNGRNGVVLPTGCFIKGEASTHLMDSETSSNFPQTVPGAKLNFTDDGFVQPNVDGDLCVRPMLKNLQLIGANNTGDGSTALASLNCSNAWDMMVVEDVFLNSCDVAFDLRGAHHTWFNRVHTTKVKRHFSGPDKHWFTACHFYSKNTGSFVQTDAGSYPNTVFTDCIFGLSPGAGEANLKVRNGTVTVKGCRFQNLNTTAGSGIDVDGSVGTNAAVSIIGNWFLNDTWDQAINLASSAVKDRIALNADWSASTNSLVIDGANGIVVPVLYGNRFSNGVSEVNSPARVRYDGTELRASAPASSDYGNQDRGTNIYDTSASPPDHYIVDASGSVLGPL